MDIEQVLHGLQSFQTRRGQRTLQSGNAQFSPDGISAIACDPACGKRHGVAFLAAHATCEQRLYMVANRPFGKLDGDETVIAWQRRALMIEKAIVFHGRSPVIPYCDPTVIG
ncbi:MULTISPECIES: hypothetical protein [Bifidobacterium]|uniref:hypothetical protein n=1 Tax=Bifidobacterium TaxID=1678 RepID=UPI001CC2C40F|nr:MULTISPECIES: hypothetical protein [Bifidobacterium]